jgi:hypothetical protein
MSGPTLPNVTNATERFAPAGQGGPNPYLAQLSPRDLQALRTFVPAIDADIGKRADEARDRGIPHLDTIELTYSAYDTDRSGHDFSYPWASQLRAIAESGEPERSTFWMALKTHLEGAKYAVNFRRTGFDLHGAYIKFNVERVG